MITESATYRVRGSGAIKDTRVAPTTAAKRTKSAWAARTPVRSRDAIATEAGIDSARTDALAYAVGARAATTAAVSMTASRNWWGYFHGSPTEAANPTLSHVAAHIATRDGVIPLAARTADNPLVRKVAPCEGAITQPRCVLRQPRGQLPIGKRRKPD